jgi:hypothetical protein
VRELWRGLFSYHNNLDILRMEGLGLGEEMVSIFVNEYLKKIKRKLKIDWRGNNIEDKGLEILIKGIGN